MVLKKTLFTHLLFISGIFGMDHDQMISREEVAPKILILSDAKIKDFLQKHGLDIEKEWSKMLRSLSYEDQDFQIQQRVLLPIFLDKLRVLEISLQNLFKRIGYDYKQTSQTLESIKKIIGEDDGHQISVTKLFKATSDHIQYEFTTMPGDGAINAVGQAVIAYFEKSFFTKRFLQGGYIDAAPFIALGVYTNDKGQLFVVSAPGMAEEDLLSPHAVRKVSFSSSASEILFNKLFLLAALVLCSFHQIHSWRILKPATGNEEVCLFFGSCCNKKPCHEVLGISVFAPEGAEKAAYRQLVKQFHPDKCITMDAQKSFAALKECKESYSFDKPPLSKIDSLRCLLYICLFMGYAISKVS